MRTMNMIFAVAMASILAACSSTPPVAPSGQDNPKAPIAVTKVAASPLPSVSTDADEFNKLKANRSIYFHFDSSQIDSSYDQMLKAYASYLSRNPQTKMTIVGNTDERGSREYNLALGQKRSDAVGQALKLRGAQAPQIEAISYGKERPKADCHDENCWKENRRADIAFPVQKP